MAKRKRAAKVSAEMPAAARTSDAQILPRMGEKLRAARERAGFTQQWVARAAKVGRATVLRYERGEISKMSELLAIADAVGCTMPELLGAASGTEAAARVLGKMDIAIPEDSERLSGTHTAMFVGAFLDLNFRDRLELLTLVRGFVIAKGAKTPLAAATLEELGLTPRT